MLLVRGLTLRSTAVYPISLTSKMSRGSSRVPEKDRETETSTVFRCDASVPSVMGKLYSFCSVVLNFLRRTRAVTPGADALLHAAPRH